MTVPTPCCLLRHAAVPAACLFVLVTGSGLELRAQDSATVPRRAVVAGMIRAERGTPIQAADVVIDSAWHTRSDARGGFRFPGIPVGAHLMEVRAIGYEPLAFDLHVGRAEEVRLTVTLSPAAQALPELVATAHQRRLDRVGYYARRETGQGRFVEGDSLVRLDSTSFVWAVGRVRGFRVLNAAALDPQPASTACPAGFTLVVNGWAAPDTQFFLRTFHPKDIEAIEIYEDAGIPNVVAKALQTEGPPAPGAETAPLSDAVTTPPATAIASGRGAAMVTTSLIRAATKDRKATPTSCTMVVWER